MQSKITPRHSFTLPAPYRGQLRRKVLTAVRNAKRFITVRRLLFVGGGLLCVAIASLLASFCWPRSVVFSYSQTNCFVNPVALPRLVSQKQSAAYKASLQPTFTIAGYPLYSHRTCVMPVNIPNPKTSETIALGSIARQRIRVAPGVLPSVQNLATLDKPLPTKRPLILRLDQNDRVFDYQLAANGHVARCAKHDRELSCPVTALNFLQSEHYIVTLQRIFNRAAPQRITQRPVTTVEAMHITATSLTSGQTVYNTPTDITVTFNKTVTSFNGIHLYQGADANRQEVPTTTSHQDATLTIHLTQPLARSTSFTLSLEQATAPDGGFLPETYTLPFQTSGGPKVLGVNIGTSRISPVGSIVVTFDSAISATQSAADFIRLEVGGSTVTAAVLVSGKHITITPKSALPRCAYVTVKVLDGLQNEFGIAGGSAWQFRSKVLCQTVFSIGTSVQGRPITAYSFGSGPSKIIFVGATHGDEKSSAYTLNSWVDYLETNADRIPANRTIIVIPIINPDGYAANRRTNAHNVDLNRNFPANDWKSGVTMPDQSYNANGGGNAPLSEPESYALANYVLSQSPRLVLTYHAIAGIVVPNGAGDSTALAQTYDQKSNVYFTADDETDSVFAYDTTGSFEGWLYDKPGIPALLVELWTMSGNEFTKHQNALWAMATIP